MPTEQETSTILGNQSGFVLVMAILVMVVLAIIGLSTTKDAQLNLVIVGNDKTSKQKFYRAEATIHEAAQRIENASADTLKARTLRGLNLASSYSPTITAASNWTTALSQTGLTTGTSYIMADKGVGAGGSLDMAASQLHSFEITGQAVDPVSGGTTFISIGYKRRF